LGEEDVQIVGRDSSKCSDAQNSDGCSVGATSDRTAFFRVIARGLGAGCTALLESENGSSSSRRPSTSRLKTTSGERRTNGEEASVGIGFEYGVEMIR
jgi:hypothetical protein